MASFIKLPPILEWIKGFWFYVIKPLWWLWLLALAIGLLPIGLNYFFRQLKGKTSKKIIYPKRENISLLEIIKKLRLVDINIHFQDCFKLDYSPTKIKIDQVIVNDALNNITLEQFEEVKKVALETAGELSKIKKEVSELPQRFKEAIAKAIVAETILINLLTLRQKISKGLIKIDSNMAVSLLIRCEKCGKFFNSGIGGNLLALLSTTFINNSHQCQYCGNMQLAKDNSDYFVPLQ